MPAAGTYGNLRRNQVVGPGFEDVDMSLLKNIPIYKEARPRAVPRGDVQRLQPHQSGAAAEQLRLRRAFGWSTSTIGVSYGAPGIGSGEPYNTQLALKIIF